MRGLLGLFVLLLLLLLPLLLRFLPVLPLLREILGPAANRLHVVVDVLVALLASRIPPDRSDQTTILFALRFPARELVPPPAMRLAVVAFIPRDFAGLAAVLRGPHARGPGLVDDVVQDGDLGVGPDVGVPVAPRLERVDAPGQARPATSENDVEEVLVGEFEFPEFLDGGAVEGVEDEGAERGGGVEDEGSGVEDALGVGVWVCGCDAVGASEGGECAVFLFPGRWGPRVAVEIAHADVRRADSVALALGCGEILVVGSVEDVGRWVGEDHHVCV